MNDRDSFTDRPPEHTSYPSGTWEIYQDNNYEAVTAEGTSSPDIPDDLPTSITDEHTTEDSNPSSWVGPVAMADRVTDEHGPPSDIDTPDGQLPPAEVPSPPEGMARMLDAAKQSLETTKLPETPVPSTFAEQDINRTQRLRELFELDPAFVAEQTEAIGRIANTVAARLDDPEQRRAVAITANIIRWDLVGHATEAPPEGLVPAQHEPSAYIVDERIPYVTIPEDHNSSVLYDEFLEGGLVEVQDGVRRQLDRHSREIKDIAREHMETGEAAAFLRSLGSPVPQTVVEERPLSPYWQRVFQGPIEQSLQVAEAAGIEPSAPQVQRLRRELQNAEDYTMPAPTQTTETEQQPLLHARSMLMGAIADAFRRSAPADQKFIGFVEKDEELYIQYTDLQTDATLQEPISRTLSFVSEDIQKNTYTGTEELKPVTYVFLRRAIYNIVTPGIATSVDDAIEQAAATQSDTLVAYAIDARTRQKYVYHYPGLSNLHLATMDSRLQPHILQSSEAPYEPEACAVRQPWKDILRPPAYFVDRNTYDQRSSQQVAVIESYGPANFRTNRVMQMRASTLQLPTANPEAESLVMYLEEPVPPGVSPHVFGYVPVSADGVRFGFAPDPQGDPHARCDVPLPLEGRARLAGRYTEIGMHDLANTVQNTPGLTVAQLEDAIVANSYPHVPQGQSSGLSPYRLRDFGEDVHDGRLASQCTRAHSFLQLSLDTAFGERHTSAILGYLIGQSAVVTALGHAQTAFVYQGRRYILDASPVTHTGLPVISNYNPSEGTSMSAPEGYMPQAPPQVSDITLPTPQQREVTPPQPMPPAEQLQKRLTGFGEQLRLLLKQHDETGVREHLVRLPEHNPIRRTYELAYQAVHGLLSPAEAGQAAALIAQLASATPDLRRQWGYDQYSQQLLDGLAETARTVSVLVAQSNTAAGA